MKEKYYHLQNQDFKVFVDRALIVFFFLTFVFVSFCNYKPRKREIYWAKKKSKRFKIIKKDKNVKIKYLSYYWKV